MAQQAFWILLLLTALSVWLQITWLSLALGVLLVALLALTVLAGSPSSPPVPAGKATHRAEATPQVVVVQPSQPHGGGMFDMFMGNLLAQSVMAHRPPSQDSFQRLDQRLDQIEKKLDKSPDDTTP